MGILGAPRKDADNPKLLVGDAIIVSFDIENLKVGDDGQVTYAVGFKLVDTKKDKLIYEEKASKEPLRSITSLGGGTRSSHGASCFASSISSCSPRLFGAARIRRRS